MPPLKSPYPELPYPGGHSKSWSIEKLPQAKVIKISTPEWIGDACEQMHEIFSSKIIIETDSKKMTQLL